MPSPASKNITGTPVDFQGVYSDAVGVPADQIYSVTHQPNAVWLWRQDRFGKYGYDLYNGVSWIDGGGNRARTNWAKDWKVVRAPIPADTFAKNSPYPFNATSDVYSLVKLIGMPTTATLPGIASAIDVLTQKYDNLGVTVASIGQSAGAAASSADAAKVAAQSNSDSGSSSPAVSQNTLLIIGGVAAAFLLLKGR